MQGGDGHGIASLVNALKNIKPLNALLASKMAINGQFGLRRIDGNGPPAEAGNIPVDTCGALLTNALESMPVLLASMEAIEPCRCSIGHSRR